MIGAKIYTTYLNVNAVGREFENRGWRIEKTTEQLTKEDNKEALLMVSKDRFHADVPPGDFMRLQLEALRPKTLIESYEVKYKQGPNGGEGYLLALYNGESQIWK
jgi:hypothetical protein